MAKFKIILYKSNQRKDGDYPACLRINKDGKGKYVDLGLSAKGEQWNEKLSRYKRDNFC